MVNEELPVTVIVYPYSQDTLAATLSSQTLHQPE